MAVVRVVVSNVHLWPDSAIAEADTSNRRTTFRSEAVKLAKFQLLISDQIRPAGRSRRVLIIRPEFTIYSAESIGRRTKRRSLESVRQQDRMLLIRVDVDSSGKRA